MHVKNQTIITFSNECLTKLSPNIYIYIYIFKTIEIFLCRFNDLSMQIVKIIEVTSQFRKMFSNPIYQLLNVFFVVYFFYLCLRSDDRLKNQQYAKMFM